MYIYIYNICMLIAHAWISCIICNVRVGNGMVCGESLEHAVHADLSDRVRLRLRHRQRPHGCEGSKITKI